MRPRRIKSFSGEVSARTQERFGDRTSGGDYWEPVSIYTSTVITTHLVWCMAVGSYRARIRRRGSGCLKEGSRGGSAHGGRKRIYERGRQHALKLKAYIRKTPCLLFGAFSPFIAFFE